MGLKETIQSILTQLRTVTVTDPDSNSVALYAAVFNDQIEREKQGENSIYPKPACFVETIMGLGLPIGHGATGYDVTFRFHLVIADYNTEGMFDEGLPIFDLRDTAHRALNQFQPTNCSHLYQAGTQMDYSHDNTIVCILDYNSHFIDMVGSIADEEVYTEATLDDPTLTIEETIYQGIFPEDVIEDYSGTVSGSVSSGYGVGPTVWRDGTGVPADSLGYNGDYYLNNTNGDVYRKIAGVYVYRTNIMGPAGVGGGVGGGFENVVMPDATYRAVSGDCIFIDENSLTAGREIDLTDLINEDDEIWVINRESTWPVVYISQDVYDAYGNAVDQVYFNSNTYLRFIDGKLRIMVG